VVRELTLGAGGVLSVATMYVRYLLLLPQARGIYLRWGAWIACVTLLFFSLGVGLAPVLYWEAITVYSTLQ